MTESNVRDELDTLKEDLNNLRRDVINLTSVLKDVAADKVDETRGSVDEELSKARRRLQGRLKEAEMQLRPPIDNLEDQITKNPFTSVFTAFSIGYLIAKLSGSRLFR